MDRSAFLTQLHGRFELPASALDELVERATGDRIAEARRLVRGDENEVHRVRLGNDTAVFVRVAFPDAPPGKLSGEAAVMQRARAAGVPAPAVLSVQTVTTGVGDRQAMVLDAATGTQLTDASPMLTDAERAAVMRDLGRVLLLMATVRLPGHNRPDERGHWPDPAQDRRRYLAAVRADSLHLEQVGFTGTEIARIGRRLDDIALDPVIDPPILCHGDISAEHLFLDDEQRVTSLIDWGMWSAGSTADELAALSANLDADDFATVLACLPDASHDGGGLRRNVATSVLTRSIGGLAWLIRSGQSDSRQRLTAAIRRAIEDLEC